MGIPRFFGWIRKQKYPGVIQDTLPENVAWLIFDTNSILHQAHQVTYAYGDYFTIERAQHIRQMPPHQLIQEFYITLITLLMNVVNQVRPTQGILIAVDGLAPQAKIQQQRQRRYKGPRSNDREDDDVEDLPPELAELRRPIVDINRITPGTEFMFNLDNFLRTWLKDPKNALQMGVNKIIYSSHLVPGEGEHKYLELLRSGDIPSTGVHVIHGMDADLFILSLIAPVERIYITREDIEEVVSIQNFRYALYRVMKNETTPSDFALLTFFIGNDFLPHQPSLLEMGKAIDALLAAYVKVGKPLTEKTENGTLIIWENLVLFLQVMADNEPILLSNQATKGFKYPSTPFREALRTKVTQGKFKTTEDQAKALRSDKTRREKHTFYYETFRDFWYRHSLGPRGDTRILEFLMQREVYPVTVDRIIENCVAYLQGLSWNLAYYMDGWNYISLDYVYPYHQTPLFDDLATIVKGNDDPDLFINGVFRSTEDLPVFNPIHQLLSVLPFESQELLPLEVRSLMDLNSPIYDMFPNQFIIDRQGTNWKREGLALIPFSEGDRIIGAVDTINFPVDRWNRYQEGGNYIVQLEEANVTLARHQRDQINKIQALFPNPRKTQGRGNMVRNTRGRGNRGRGRGGGQTTRQTETTTHGRGGRGRSEGQTTRGRGERSRGAETTREKGRGNPRGGRSSFSQPRGEHAYQPEPAPIEKKTKQEEQWKSNRFL